MALKGTTRIELTNVKTGEKEVIEKDNLVTNAVPSALDNPFALQLRSYPYSDSFTGNILPLCPNLFGGILLYEDAIPEDVNQLYAQSTNKLVGYSSNNVNDKTDIMRGSMNPNESGPLDSNDGYRFVFDFTTSQANGRIGAVGLTSKWGGMAGYGSTEWKNTQSPCVLRDSYKIADAEIAYAYTKLLRYDENTGIATAVYVSAQNMITVVRIRLHTKNWKLTRPLYIVDPTQVLDTQFIETDTFAGTTVSGELRYHNFCDGGDGYIWGFEHAGNASGNSSGSASINWIKIKLDDLSFEEGTWTIEGQLYRMGRRCNGIYYTTNYRYSDTADSVVLDGYLYCFNYDLTGLYKINLSNVTDIVFIEHPDKKIATVSQSSNHYWFYKNSANIAIAGNRVCIFNGWINDDFIVKNMFSNSAVSNTDNNLGDGWIDNENAYNYPFRNSCGAHGIRIGVFLLYIDGYKYYQSDAEIFANIILDAPYLATINNLPTPVEKTADKTMKITYILREETV